MWRRGTLWWQTVKFLTTPDEHLRASPRWCQVLTHYLWLLQLFLNFHCPDKAKSRLGGSRRSTRDDAGASDLTLEGIYKVSSSMISSWFAAWFARWMIASILRVPGGAMPRPTQTEHLLPSDLIWKQLTENVWRKEAGDLYGEIMGFYKKTHKIKK